MDEIKLAGGQLTPKVDFVRQSDLLEHLKVRARLYRSSFGLDELQIQQNLLIENALQSDSIQLEPVYLQGLAAAATLLPRKNISKVGKKSASLTLDELDLENRSQPRHVISGLIPENSVNLLAGDSGIGKSPFLVQMGLCMAAGVPFLDQDTLKAPVLYVDYENGWSTLAKFGDTITKFLDLPNKPTDFHILHQPGSPDEVSREVMILQPKLVLIDALRGYDSSLEEKNAAAGQRLTELLHFAEHAQTSILLLHHLRKTSQEFPTKPLEAAPVMEWMQQVSGPRALINQTMTRIGTESYASKGAEMILKGHFKGLGEFGPWYIAREYDESGEPIGYYRVTGTPLLKPEHLTIYLKLPQSFSFKTAAQLVGKSKWAAVNFLNRLLEAKLVTKHGDGKTVRYDKLPTDSTRQV